MGLLLTGLTCNDRENPLGIDDRTPQFGWIMESDQHNVVQQSYQIIVKKAGNIVWDSGRKESDKSTHIRYEGSPLESVTEYQVEVKVTDNYGNEGVAEGQFETALLNQEDWKAQWAEPVQKPAYHEPPQVSMDLGFSEVPIEDIKMEPAQIIRKEFTLPKQVQKARAYATAHGIYYMEIDGRRVGDYRLAPGNTSYDGYLEYQTYDITEHLRSGAAAHAVAMVLGDGWYRGKVGVAGQNCQFGDKLAGLFQLEVTYTDGTRECIVSDQECQGATGPILYADLFVGQCYDANKEQPGYSLPEFDAAGWQPVEVKDYGYENLRAEAAEPVRVIEILKPEAILKTPAGETILDVGRVVAGNVRMRVQGPKGTKVVLNHTEVLDKAGNYICNIIGACVKQMDTYILKGEGVEVFDPEFTFHGFRYVKISGYPGEPSVDDFDIMVVASDMETIGEFSCSDPRLNQLQENIYHSLRGNTISIPTDCPQREKAGWTGDVQIIGPTACYVLGAKSFFGRWLRNVQIDQQEDGQIPNVVPYIKAYYPDEVKPNNTHCSAGWGDVAVTLPWNLYEAYGDTDVLAENYEMMKKWVEYVRYTAEHEQPEQINGEMTAERERWSKYLWNTNFHFGDWLTPSVSFNYETGDVDMGQSAFRTMDIIPTIFYAYSTDIMTKTAAVLGNDEDVAYYRQLHEKVKDAFINEYVDEQGYISTELQGVYVLALQMELIPEQLRGNTVQKLLELIRENGGKLDTGFLSVPYLLDVLLREGGSQRAYDMLFMDECPSWLYEVKMGATTIWEAWQAILPDGTPTSVSYNHYAFGCVGKWMYQNIAGISPASPGYKRIRIQPQMDQRISSARGSYQSVYGRIVSEWKLEDGQMNIRVRVPCNTTAEIHLPQKNGDAIIKKVGSGVYEYSYSYEN